MAASSDLRITIRAVDQASGVISGVSRALSGLGSAMALPGKAIGGLVSGLGKIGLAGIGIQALTSAAQGLSGVLGVNVNNSLEQARAGINAFTKDAGQTEQILEMVRARAAATPFSFQEMATAAGSLMPIMKSTGISLETLIENAEILAASNPLEGLAGASFSLREAMTGDFTSIIERFNLSRQSINRWKEEGLSNFEIVQRAMAEMGFDADLVAAKSETLEGRWSTFNDTLDTFKAKAGESLFDGLKQGLIFLQGAFEANQDAIMGFAQGISDTIGSAITTVQALFAAFTVDAGAMGIVMEQLTKVFGEDFATAIEPFVQGFTEAIPAIKEFAAGVAEAVAKLPEMVEQVKEMATGFAELATTSGAFEALGKAVQDFGNDISNVAGFVSEHAAAQMVLVSALTAGATAWALYRAAAIATTAITAAQTAATISLTAAQTALNVALTANPIGVVIVALAALTAAIVYAYQTNEEFRAQWDAAWNSAIAIINTVQGAVEAALNGISAAISAVAGTSEAQGQSIGWGIVNGIVAGISGGIPAVTAAAMRLGQAAISAAMGALREDSPSKEFAEIGRNICAGLAIGIDDNTFKAVRSAEDLAQALMDVFEANDIAQPVRDQMVQLVRDIEIWRGELEKQEGILGEMREGRRIDELFNEDPKLIEFRTKALEIRRAEVALRQQMQPLLIAERKAEEELSKVREEAAKRLKPLEDALDQARDAGNKKRIESAQKAVEEMKRQNEATIAGAQAAVDAARAPLQPLEEQMQAIRDTKDELDLQREQWEATREAIDITADAAEQQQERQIEVVKAGTKAIEGQVEKIGEAGDAWGEWAGDVENAVGDVSDAFNKGDFQSVMDAFNIKFPDLAERALGGPVGGGMPYLVGEHGPELFVPDRNGGIIPNHALGGGITIGQLIVQDAGNPEATAVAVRNELVKLARRNGGSAFGGLG